MSNIKALDTARIEDVGELITQFPDLFSTPISTAPSDAAWDILRIIEKCKFDEHRNISHVRVTWLMDDVALLVEYDRLRGFIQRQFSGSIPSLLSAYRSSLQKSFELQEIASSKPFLELEFDKQAELFRKWHEVAERTTALNDMAPKHINVTLLTLYFGRFIREEVAERTGRLTSKLTWFSKCTALGSHLVDDMIASTKEHLIGHPDYSCTTCKGVFASTLYCYLDVVYPICVCCLIEQWPLNRSIPDAGLVMDPIVDAARFSDLVVAGFKQNERPDINTLFYIIKDAILGSYPTHTPTLTPAPATVLTPMADSDM